MSLQQFLRNTAGALVMATAFVALPSLASAADTHVYVRVGPPHAVVEHRPASPGAGFVWVPGYYVHNGSAYVWTQGRWERPPRARARWVNPHWRHERRGWFFVEGRWR